ncbi:catechol O-methyltransferase A-like isoform X2 [Hemitrygon akajei]|uniref:catechol O-methyltransferase A-like isoform X2 n=1 Tax=Hemitrygon akajei TaxID=2704970 RepID=UPI003BF9F997
MEVYLAAVSILLASLVLLFFLLPILLKHNSRAAIFWHAVLEKKMAELITGTSRESRILEYVLRNAVRGDAKSVVNSIDNYCREKEWAMNVGDEKGAILDRLLEETNPSTVLELGTYCGYSALRMGRVLKPGAHLLTIEFNPTCARVAKQIFHFAGVENKECGLLREGTVLLADNVISPGAPEFLQYVRNNPRYECTHYASHLEYTKLKDGMEKAVFKG